MLVSFRSAILVFAAAAASSVAPAQVGPTSSEPILPVTNASLPRIVVPEPITNPTYTPEQIEPADGISPDGEETEAPTPRPTGDLSSMVAQLRSSDPGSRELECLAAGVYFESKSEPLAGQLAVGEVIANRADSGRFPSSYCGVLFQRGQFSFVRGHSWPKINKSGRQWKTAVAIAKIVDQDLKDSVVGNALFFHAKRVSPKWRLKRVASVGNHIFYR
jgi:spore germination cell wall hydrolase CwlJ-like protein